jgi:hypothetical protein
MQSLELLNKSKITNSELALFSHRHIGGWGSKAFSQFVGVVTFHCHANPRKLHPNPPFVVVIGWWFLVKLKLLNDGLSIKILEIFEVFRLRFFFFDVFDFGYKIIGFYFFLGLLIVLFLFII